MTNSLAKNQQIVWLNVFAFVILHLGAFYGIFLLFSATKSTLLWVIWLTIFAGHGVLCGAHRYFAHRSHKATLPLRIIYLLAETIAGQNSVYIWVRDHRLHHKHSETDADPHNSKRGFFFAHMGWLMCKKHPLVKLKGRTIDLTDLQQDSLVMFQYKNYYVLYLVFAVVLPIVLPVWVWDESWNVSIFVCYFFRYLFLLHVSWLTNSLAHWHGLRPYDKRIAARECSKCFVLMGEQFHNFHHTFPWDYRAAEEGLHYSVATFIIDLYATCGLAYDLRTANWRNVRQRSLRTGDGSNFATTF